MPVLGVIFLRHAANRFDAANDRSRQTGPAARWTEKDSGILSQSIGESPRARGPSHLRRLHQLESRLKEPQQLWLVREPQTPYLRTLLKHLRHALGHHVHVRLRVHATRNR